MASVVRFVFCLLFFVATAHALPTFPGCEGYGCVSTAGAGITRGNSTNVCIVTSLSAAETGSSCTRTNCAGKCHCGTLKYCVQPNQPGPKYVVFEVSGEIQYNGDLRMETQHMYVAGQTAPAPGISLRQTRVMIVEDDIVLRHMWLIPDGDTGSPICNIRDPILVTNSDFVGDHLGIFWGPDENIDLVVDGDVESNITISRTISAEPLRNPACDPTTNNARSIRIGDDVDKVDVHHSVFVSGRQRNPRLKSEDTRWINNIVYNWANIAGHQNESNFDGNNFFDWMGNYYKVGPETTLTATTMWRNTPSSAASRYYINDHTCSGCTGDCGSSGDWNCVDANTPQGTYDGVTSVTEVAANPITVDSAADTYTNLANTAGVRDVGPFPFYVNANSFEPATRVLDYIKDGTSAGFVDCGAGCANESGASLPTWPEDTVTFDIPANKDTVISGGDYDGYTNMEEALDVFALAAVAGPVGGGDPPQPPQQPSASGRKFGGAKRWHVGKRFWK